MLERLGLFGVRLAVELIVAGRVQLGGRAGRRARGAQRHRRAARRCSTVSSPPGLPVLKARSTLATVSALAEIHGGAKGRMLRDRVRDVERGAHELVEIRLLSLLRTRRGRTRRRRRGRGAPDPRRQRGRRQRAHGADTVDTSDDDVRAAALDTIGRWRVVVEDPFLSPDGREVARGVVRSCEALAVSRDLTIGPVLHSASRPVGRSHAWATAWESTSARRSRLPRCSATGNVEVFPLATYQVAVPSVIFADGDDLLFAGAGRTRGASQPLGLAREFKRRLGDPVPIMLSGAAVPRRPADRPDGEVGRRLGDRAGRRGTGLAS